jgi:TatD DNase family protein
MMIETHAHLDFPQYDLDRDDVIERAKSSGIQAIINVGSTFLGSVASVALADRYDLIYAACGIHPNDAGIVDDDTIIKFKDLIRQTGKVVAIGEVGIDLYRNTTPGPAQQDAFKRFILLGKEFDLPLIIHCREQSPGQRYASDLLFEIMKENLDMPYKGVMHCFSGDEQLLGRCIDSGLHVSYTCNITYKNAGRLRDMVKKTPIDRLLLETDSPFLSPQDKRGMRNEPSHIRYLIKAISESTGLSEAEIEEHTDRNARGLFSI